MKWMAVAAALLLAGCTLPGDEEDKTEVFGACPQWITGPEPTQHELAVNGTDRLTIEAANETQGYPLDMFLLQIQTDAPVKVLARVDGERRAEFHITNGQGTTTAPHLNVDDVRHARVFLSPVEHGSAPAPGPLVLDFDGQATVQVEAQPFYRVCGQLL